MKSSTNQTGRNIIEIIVVIAIISLLTICGVYYLKIIQVKAQVKSVTERLISLKNQRLLHILKQSGKNIYFDKNGPFETELTVENGIGPQNNDYFWITVKKDNPLFCREMVKADVGAVKIDDQDCPRESTFYFLKNGNNTIISENPDKKNQPTIICYNGTEYLSGNVCKPCKDKDPNSIKCNNQGIPEQCKEGYYMSSNTCMACPNNAQCNDGESFICEEGFKLEGNRCVLNCTATGETCDPNNEKKRCYNGRLQTCLYNLGQWANLAGDYCNGNNFKYPCEAADYGNFRCKNGEFQVCLGEFWTPYDDYNTGSGSCNGNEIIPCSEEEADEYRCLNGETVWCEPSNGWIPDSTIDSCSSATCDNYGEYTCKNGNLMYCDDGTWSLFERFSFSCNGNELNTCTNEGETTCENGREINCVNGIRRSYSIASIFCDGDRSLKCKSSNQECQSDEYCDIGNKRCKKVFLPAPKEISGIGLTWGGTEEMTWESAQNWCEANGKQQVTINDLKCYAKNSTVKDTSSYCINCYEKNSSQISSIVLAIEQEYPNERMWIIGQGHKPYWTVHAPFQYVTNHVCPNGSNTYPNKPLCK